MSNNNNEENLNEDLEATNNENTNEESNENESAGDAEQTGLPIENRMVYT